MVAASTCAPAALMFPIKIASSAIDPEIIVTLDMLEPITICFRCRVPEQI
jgi:hypothetical protein